MDVKIEKIVVCGVGAAGANTFMNLLYAFPNVDFTVVDFDKVEDKVISQLKETSKVIPLRRRILGYMVPIAAAASLLLLVLLNIDNDPVVTFDSLATSEIESLIEEGMIDINVESLAMVFPDVEFENDVFETTLSNEEVLDYLNYTELENITFDN